MYNTYNTRILVDADACPVKDIIVKVAKEFKLKVIMFTDTSHIIEEEYSQVITVSQGKDAVDIALINQTQKGDIVVTQDYGVASMALGKQAYAINQNGLIYDETNIDRLLMERYLSQKIRRGGGRTHNPRKRNVKSDISFEKSFRKLCKRVLGL
ncbi:MAG: YaiI/YqxD family protein [Caldicoprobacterales bacterium]|nr:YaiI/YqxD family protein [Clostridiales bacterium]